MAFGDGTRAPATPQHEAAAAAPPLSRHVLPFAVAVPRDALDVCNVCGDVFRRFLRGKNCWNCGALICRSSSCASRESYDGDSKSVHRTCKPCANPAAFLALRCHDGNSMTSPLAVCGLNGSDLFHFREYAPPFEGIIGRIVQSLLFADAMDRSLVDVMVEPASVSPGTEGLMRMDSPPARRDAGAAFPPEHLRIATSRERSGKAPDSDMLLAISEPSTPRPFSAARRATTSSTSFTTASGSSLSLSPAAFASPTSHHPPHQLVARLIHRVTFDTHMRLGSCARAVQRLWHPLLEPTNHSCSHLDFFVGLLTDAYYCTQMEVVSDAARSHGATLFQLLAAVRFGVQQIDLNSNVVVRGVFPWQRCADTFIGVSSPVAETTTHVILFNLSPNRLNLPALMNTFANGEMKRPWKQLRTLVIVGGQSVHSRHDRVKNTSPPPQSSGSSPGACNVARNVPTVAGLNNFIAPCLMSLASLSASKTLRHLALVSCNLCDVDIVQLRHIFLAGTALPLETLNLACNSKLTDACRESLVDILCHVRKSLKFVVLSNTNIGDQFARRLPYVFARDGLSTVAKDLRVLDENVLPTALSVSWRACSDIYTFDTPHAPLTTPAISPGTSPGSITRPPFITVARSERDLMLLGKTCDEGENCDEDDEDENVILHQEDKDDAGSYAASQPPLRTDAAAVEMASTLASDSQRRHLHPADDATMMGPQIIPHEDGEPPASPLVPAQEGGSVQHHHDHQSEDRQSSTRPSPPPGIVVHVEMESCPALTAKGVNALLLTAVPWHESSAAAFCRRYVRGRYAWDCATFAGVVFSLSSTINSTASISVLPVVTLSQVATRTDRGAVRGASPAWINSSVPTNSVEKDAVTPSTNSLHVLHRCVREYWLSTLSGQVTHEMVASNSADDACAEAYLQRSITAANLPLRMKAEFFLFAPRSVKQLVERTALSEYGLDEWILGDVAVKNISVVRHSHSVHVSGMMPGTQCTTTDRGAADSGRRVSDRRRTFHLTVMLHSVDIRDCRIRNSTLSVGKDELYADMYDDCFVINVATLNRMLRLGQRGIVDVPPVVNTDSARPEQLSLADCFLPVFVKRGNGDGIVLKNGGDHDAPIVVAGRGGETRAVLNLGPDGTTTVEDWLYGGMAAATTGCHNADSLQCPEEATPSQLANVSFTVALGIIDVGLMMQARLLRHDSLWRLSRFCLAGGEDSIVVRLVDASGVRNFTSVISTVRATPRPSELTPLDSPTGVAPDQSFNNFISSAASQPAASLTPVCRDDAHSMPCRIDHDLLAKATAYQIGFAAVELFTLVGRNHRSMTSQQRSWVPALFDDALPRLRECILACLAGFPGPLRECLKDCLESSVESPLEFATQSDLNDIGSTFWNGIVFATLTAAAGKPLHFNSTSPPIQVMDCHVYECFVHSYTSLCKAILRTTSSVVCGLNASRPGTGIEKAKAMFFRVPPFAKASTTGASEGVADDVLLCQPMGSETDPFSRLSLFTRPAQEVSRETCLIAAILDALYLVDARRRAEHGTGGQHSILTASVSKSLGKWLEAEFKPLRTAGGGHGVEAFFQRAAAASGEKFHYHFVKELSLEDVRDLFRLSLSFVADRRPAVPSRRFAAVATFPFVAIVVACQVCVAKAKPYFPFACTPIPSKVTQHPYMHCFLHKNDVNRTIAYRRCLQCRRKETGTPDVTHAIAVDRVGVDGRVAKDGFVFLYDRMIPGLELHPFPFAALIGESERGWCATHDDGHPNPTQPNPIGVDDAGMGNSDLLPGEAATPQDDGAASVSLSPPNGGLVFTQLIRVHADDAANLLPTAATRAADHVPNDVNLQSR